jgi:hypothetical protein
LGEMGPTASKLPGVYHIDIIAHDQPSEAVLGRTNQTQAVALLELYIKAEPSLAASRVAGWRCVFAVLDALPAQEAVRDCEERGGGWTFGRHQRTP